MFLIKVSCFNFLSITKTKAYYYLTTLKTKNKMRSLRKLLKLKFLEMLAQTTFHGLGKLVTSKQLIQKIVWFILTLASYSYCSFYTNSLMISYFEYPVVTNIEDVYENQPLFPGVTICGHRKTFSCYFNNMPCDRIPSMIIEKNDFCSIINSGFNQS